VNKEKGFNMQRKSLDAWVGIFVLAGVAALAFLALKAAT
jgi:phospholipid/cholesterol/gamma-HCH transport system substrate-binding protein